MGLAKAKDQLVKAYGFDETKRPAIRRDSPDEVTGSVTRLTEGLTVSVTFVLGDEQAAPSEVFDLVKAANGDRLFTLTTSWYSAISHIPTAARRAAFFHMLDEVTDPQGELLIAPSVSGDLVELQAEWAERLLAGDIGSYPIEQPGDVIYETELGQENFYHVFGTNLADLLTSIQGPGRRTWLEAIRMPDPEFESRNAEQANYHRVQEFNKLVGDRQWQAEDYRQVHTALAVRSGHHDRTTEH